MPKKTMNPAQGSAARDRVLPVFPLRLWVALEMNQSVCRLIQTKLQRCSLPTGVFTSLLTLLSRAVIPLIYYGMVIGQGVAVTPSGRIMNHVAENILSYLVTPKEVITWGRERFRWSTVALKSSLRRCRGSLWLRVLRSRVAAVFFMAWGSTPPFLDAHGWLDRPES